MRSASSASTNAPVAVISFALASPTARGNSADIPHRGSAPSLAWVSANRARSDAMHDVAAEHELEAAGHARAVHRRDHRLPDRPQRGTGVGRRERRAERDDLLDVGARGEHGVDRGEHDHVDRVVAVDVARELLDLLAHRERERVLGLGPVDGEREHAIGDLGAEPVDGKQLGHEPTFSRELSQVMRSRSGVMRRSRRPTS